MANKRPVKPKAERRQGARNGDAMAAKLARFKEHYLSNDMNATAAAIAIGHSPRAAHQRGYELVRKLRANGDLPATARRVAQLAELNTANVLREAQRIALNDPRRFFAADGRLLDPVEWDEHMAACVQSIEVSNDGEARKIKFWPKLDALEKLMRYQGLFEKDNRQKADNLAIQVNFVAPGPRPEPPARAVQVQATLVKPNGNGSHP